MNHISLASGVFAIAFATSLSAHAGIFGDGASKLEAQATVDDNSAVHKLSPDHVVVLSMSEQTMTAKKKKSPFNKASGPCFGMIDLKPNVTTGNGYCVMKDTKGQSFVIAWTATDENEKGESSGNWTLNGGQGRWSDAKGGGTWQFETVSTNGKPKRINKITGEFTMK